MFCTECGTENRNDRKFCTECGAKLQDYTKPRENLVMPEDLAREEKAKRNIKKSLSAVIVLASLLFVIATALLVAAFAVNGLKDYRIYLVVASIVIYVIMIVALIVQAHMKRSLDNEV